MNSFLKNDLLGLRSKLESIEKEFEVKLQDVESKQSKFERLDQQLNELISTKDSLIKLNVGGKIYKTKTSTLLGVKDTLFYKLIGYKMETNEDLTKELFFDRSYTHFEFILDYLRNKKFNLKLYKKYELEEILSECKYYGLSEILSELEKCSKEIEFVKFESSPQYSTAGTHKVEDLSDKSCNKGICVSSPYEILIELNSEHEVNAMEIAGWNGNTNIWGVNNGAGAKVSTSTDKTNWKEVGQIPSDYNSTIKMVKLTPSSTKYIKFKASGYLGIGYLKLHNSQE